MSTTYNEMVKAIRNDVLIGRGTCSSTDESMDDSDLIVRLKEEGISSVPDAISLMREDEEFHLEMGTNASSGEANCPLVARYNRYIARRAELEAK